MVSCGADIIDIGGESSRPYARPISVEEEIQRVIPVLKKLVKRINVPISIDTYKPEVAKRALDLGVSIINDITALRKNQEMARLISSYKAGVILMHMKGRPLTMQRSPNYSDVVSEIIDYLNRAITFALNFGIEREKIIIDPGIGFGKNTEHNLEILRRLREFKVLGRPLLVGVSRKSFIGNVLNKPVEDRLFGTLASVSLAIANGADIVRVHDVKEISDTVKICDAILRDARY
jgi:dihydropteroate synthase